MTYSETIVPAAGQYHSDLPAEELIAQINHLRREKNAVILAHNYQIPPIQDLADFTGDSLGLSVEAAKTDAERIVFLRACISWPSRPKSSVPASRCSCLI